MTDYRANQPRPDGEFNSAPDSLRRLHLPEPLAPATPGPAVRTPGNRRRRSDRGVARAALDAARGISG